MYLFERLDLLFQRVCNGLEGMAFTSPAHHLHHVASVTSELRNRGTRLPHVRGWPR